MSKVTLVTIMSPVSSQVERKLVMLATTSIASAFRLFSGLNRVTSPVAAGMATAGQAERTVRTPVSTTVPSPAQPARIIKERAATAALGFDTGVSILTLQRVARSRLPDAPDDRKRVPPRQ